MSKVGCVCSACVESFAAHFVIEFDSMRNERVGAGDRKVRRLLTTEAGRMTRLVQRERTRSSEETSRKLQFIAVEVVFTISRGAKRYPLNDRTFIVNPVSTVGPPYTTVIVKEFVSTLTIRYNGRRVLAPVSGSFAAVLRGKVLAHVHVVPTALCRKHGESDVCRWYYLGGVALCATDERQQSNLSPLKSAIHRQLSIHFESPIDNAIVADSERQRGSNGIPAVAGDRGLAAGVPDRERSEIDERRRRGETPKRNEESNTRNEFSSTWLDMSPWLNRLGHDGVGRLADTVKKKYPCLTVRSLELSECLNSVNNVIASSVVLYPLPVAGYRYVMHIMRNAGRTLVSSERLIHAMQRQKLIGNGLRKCRHPEAFLLEDAKPGTYSLRCPLLGVETFVVVCDYDPYHAGHRGRFACGYPYFLCGSDSSTPYRVVLRADVDASNLSNGSDAHGAEQNLRVTVSRSYSGDCQGPEFIRGVHPLRGPGPNFPPLPVSAPPLRGSYAFTPLVDWMLSQAEVESETDSSPSLEGTERVDNETFVKEQHPEIPLSDPRPVGVRGDNGHTCKACGTPQREPLRECARYHQNIYAFIDAGVLLENTRFHKHLKLIESCCGKCEASTDLRRETADLARIAKRAAAYAWDVSNAKYYHQRHRLILRFGPTLRLSGQAWFSICPEEIARHIATRLAKLARKLNRPLRVLEPFCGAGGNAVNCARMPHVEMVYAIDINKSETSNTNALASLYNVRSKIYLQTMDIRKLRASDLFTRVDAVVFSPPWGGPEYQAEFLYDLAAVQEPATYSQILRNLMKFSSNMAVLMPRNTCLDQVVESARKINSTAVELEQNVLAGKIKTVTLYYGDLAN